MVIAQLNSRCLTELNSPAMLIGELNKKLGVGGVRFYCPAQAFAARSIPLVANQVGPELFTFAPGCSSDLYGALSGYSPSHHPVGDHGLRNANKRRQLGGAAVLIKQA